MVSRLCEVAEMTQHGRILEMMKMRKVSSMDAFREGATRLSAIVFDLRRDGIKVLDEWKEGHNRYGEKTRYKVYWVEEDKECTTKK